MATRSKSYKISLHSIVDLTDQEQRLIHDEALRRIKEVGVEIVEDKRGDADAHLALVLHGNSAREIVATAEGAECPCIIWATRERWAWPSSSLAMGKLLDDGGLVKLVYGQPNEPETVQSFLAAVKVSYTIKELSRSRIGAIGKVYPNLVSCAYDAEEIEDNLDVKVSEISYDAVREAMDAVGEADVQALIQETGFRCIVDVDVPGKYERGIKLHLALKRIAKQRKINAFAVECWSGFPKEFGVNPCFGFVEDDYLMACEGDVLLAVTHILARAISGVSSYAGDIYDLGNDRVLTLNHCGAPASLAINGSQAIIRESRQTADLGCPTLVCRPPMAMGPVTLLRLHGRACERMHMARGEMIAAENLDRMTVKVRIEGDPKHFIENCTGNHYVVAPGDLTEESRLFCRWKNIDLIET